MFDSELRWMSMLWILASFFQMSCRWERSGWDCVSGDNLMDKHASGGRGSHTSCSILDHGGALSLGNMLKTKWIMKEWLGVVVFPNTSVGISHFRPKQFKDTDEKDI